MEILIRQISVEDAAAVSSLSQQLGYDLSPSETGEQIRQVLASSDHCAFVAMRHEKIIGWIHGFQTIRLETRPFAEIGGLIVDENFRGTGIGKRLLHRVKEWCAAQNMVSLRVRCNTKRTQAHRFYLSSGFIESKDQKVFSIEL